MATIKSIEEKAKSFKEALSRAKGFYKRFPEYKEILEKIFPELKESEDERTWIINYLNNRILNSTIIAEKENLKKAIAWLEKQCEQNPSWSEEDEEIYRKCICAMRASACGFPEEEKFVEQVDNWLKSLKDRVLPQPKQEWSEEDESHIRYLIECLEHCKKGVALTMTTSTSQEYINWLKSLKPQSTWKPSDEQIKLLNEVLIFAASHESPHWNDYIFGTLNNLIRQLKKLREE